MMYRFGGLDVTERIAALRSSLGLIEVNNRHFTDPRPNVYKFLTKHPKIADGNSHPVTIVLGGEDDMALDTDLEKLSSGHDYLTACARAAPLDEFIRERTVLFISSTTSSTLPSSTNMHQVVQFNRITSPPSSCSELPADKMYGTICFFDIIPEEEQHQEWKNHVLAGGYVIWMLDANHLSMTDAIRRISYFMNPIVYLQSTLTHHILVCYQTPLLDVMKIYWYVPHASSPTAWAKTLFVHIPHQNVASIEASDIVVSSDLTTNDAGKNMQEYHEMITLCNNKQKSLVVFVHDDINSQMPLFLEQKTNSFGLLTFRTSLCKSLCEEHERLLPSFQCADNSLLPLSPVILEGKPTVGFLGATTHPIRKQSCVTLFSDSRFVCEFEGRGQFHGLKSPEQQAIDKQRFMDIMTKNVFQLCCRGAGNFSHRFYEVLAYGRIPVLIDTDMVIPPHIPLELWQECVVFAPDVESLPDLLYNFYVTHDIVETQLKCRKMWQDYLSYSGFAKFVANEMATKLIKIPLLVKKEETKLVVEESHIYIFWHVWYNETHHAQCESILQRQFEALVTSKLMDACQSLFVGLVSSCEEYQLPLQIRMHPKLQLIAREKSGFEEVTLCKLKKFVDDDHHNNKARILYIHTRGVTHEPTSQVGIASKDWTRMMEFFLIFRWQQALEALKTHHTAGCEMWAHPCRITKGKEVWHYSGNFWWANGSYLRQLRHPLNYGSCIEFVGEEVHRCMVSEDWVLDLVERKYPKEEFAVLHRTSTKKYTRGMIHLDRYPIEFYSSGNETPDTQLDPNKTQGAKE